MKRNAKIIQISGIKGLITALFVVTCLAAGFVAFPGFVAMNIWNHFAGSSVPEINLYQGILLWAIVALVYFIANKQSFSVSFESPKELNPSNSPPVTYTYYSLCFIFPLFFFIIIFFNFRKKKRNMIAIIVAVIIAIVLIIIPIGPFAYHFATPSSWNRADMELRKELEQNVCFFLVLNHFESF